MFKKLMVRLFLISLCTVNIYSRYDSSHVVNVSNYPSSMNHYVSGNVLNVHRFATSEEKELAAQKAQLQLDRLNKSFLQNLSEDLYNNVDYVMKARPFEVVSNRELVAIGILAYLGYCGYQKYQKMNKTDNKN